MNILIKKTCFIIFALLQLVGCCPKDFAANGVTPPCPDRFWKGPHEPVCPCTNDIDCDEVLKESEEELQKENVEIVDLINAALLNNPSTQITWANARAAAYGVGIAESTLYPTVLLTEEVNYLYNDYDEGLPTTTFASTAGTTTTTTTIPADSGDNKNVLPTNTRAKTIVNPLVTTPLSTTTASAFGSLNIVPGYQVNSITDITISYLLLDFGGRRASIEAAKQALYSSNWTHNRQVQQVIVNVLQTYYNYAGTTALLEARYDDLKNSQANYDSALNQFEAGVKNKLDVLQAKTNLINIELDIVTLQGQQRVAYGNLANALGLPSNIQINIPKLTEELGTDVIQENIDELVKIAWERRPDLASAYALHDYFKQQVIIARSSGLPTLNTLWNFEEFASFRNPSFNNHSVSGSLIISAPLFSGFLYTNEERQAKENVRAACGNIRNIELLISQDIVTSYFNFKTSVKSLKVAKENFANSDEAYRAAFVTYKEGISTILDLLLAQQNLSEAKAQVIQAKTSWAITLSNISFALGTIGSEDEILPWEIKK